MSANTVSDDYGQPADDAIGLSKPNSKSWKYISVNNIFNETRSIEVEFSLLAIADSHMIKSSQWAAVTYLAETINNGEEIWINNQEYFG